MGIRGAGGRWPTWRPFDELFDGMRGNVGREDLFDTPDCEGHGNDDWDNLYGQEGHTGVRLPCDKLDLDPGRWAPVKG